MTKSFVDLLVELPDDEQERLERISPQRMKDGSLKWMNCSVSEIEEWFRSSKPKNSKESQEKE